jgi:hypothetical protein
MVFPPNLMPGRGQNVFVHVISPKDHQTEKKHPKKEKWGQSGDRITEQTKGANRQSANPFVLLARRDTQL